MEQSQSTDKNYSIISPTAKYVLLFKGNTGIPYARQVAELVSLPDKYEPDFTKKDFMWWIRVLHFETRYKSIDQLLLNYPAKNVLELSSGFSFRGLKAVQERDLHYIDTDLPDMIATKKEFVAALRQGNTTDKGTLEILPLNALDEDAFAEVVARFPPGEIAIVNEGLLMYLDMEEKKKLCGIIRKALQQRGGCWITADIYIKTKYQLPPDADAETQQIFDEMNIEGKKFESFKAAEDFFASEGFVIDKEAEPDYNNTDALQYLLASATQEQMDGLKKGERIQTTWRLKLA